MLLWIIFAILTSFAAILLVSPFWRANRGDDAQRKDVAVYKQQLAEVDDEHARGLLGDAEAEAARIEISRRILNANAAAEDAAGSRASSMTPYVIVALVATMSMGTYLYYGSPQLPDRPLASRSGPDEGPSIENLVARVEERLREHPEDGQGWNVISRVYMRMGRYEDAAKAFRKTIELLGSTPERQSNLGEALTMANSSRVTEEAAAAFKKALETNPNDTRAAFWLAAQHEQKGEFEEAAKRYRKLAEGDLPDNARNLINQRLASVESRISGQPSFDTDQRAMIDGMVSGLAERLKADGSDLDGWLKLMRAYTVLGRRDDALNAMKQARSNFSGNEDALAQIDEFAKSLGLRS